MSIEGIALEHFSALLQTEINSSTKSYPCHAVFHFLSDDSKQDSATTISIERFLCAIVVAESCLLSSDKKNETLHDVDMILWMVLFLSVAMH